MSAITFLIAATVLGADYRGMTTIQQGANHGIVDDLPDRPRIDQIPFYDRSHLGSPTRSTISDPHHSFATQTWQQPTNNSQLGFGQNPAQNYSTSQTQPGFSQSSFSQPQSSLGYSQPSYTQPGYGQPGQQQPSYGAGTYGTGTYGAATYGRDNHSFASQPYGQQSGTWGQGSGVLNPPPTTRWNDLSQLPRTGTQAMQTGIPYRPGYDADRYGYRDPYAGHDNFGYQNQPTHGTSYPSNPSTHYGTYAGGDRGPLNPVLQSSYTAEQPLRDNRSNWDTTPRVADTRGTGYSTAGTGLSANRPFDPFRPVANSISGRTNDPYYTARNGGMSATFASLLLFASLGGNIYLGWLARDFYSRYRDAIWELRSANSSSVE